MIYSLWKLETCGYMNCSNPPIELALKESSSSRNLYSTCKECKKRTKQQMKKRGCLSWEELCKDKKVISVDKFDMSIVMAELL